jgi:hypothetical protein
MFRYLQDGLFLTSVALYALNRWAVKPSLPSGETFFSGHFNDLLVIPCALPPLLLLHRRLDLRRTDTPPGAGEIALHLAVWSIFFEVLAPAFVRTARADAWDVVAYCAGGLASWLVWNRAALVSRIFAPRHLIEFSTPNPERSFNPHDEKMEPLSLHRPHTPQQQRRRARAEEEVLRRGAPFPV